MYPFAFRSAFRATMLTAGILLVALLIGCGGSNKFITPAPSGSTMLILGTPSGAEYAELTKSYQPLREDQKGAALIEKHKVVAVECNSFTATELSRHATVKRALSSQIPVVFLHMTEAHKKAIMQPAVGVSTAGTSPAVTIIQGKRSDHAHPGIIIESDLRIDAAPKAYGKGQIPTLAFEPVAKTAAGRASVTHSDPAAFVARIKEAVSGALASSVGDETDGLYDVPTGLDYYMVILTSYDQTVTLPKQRDIQTARFTPTWYIYVMDDLAVNKSSQARKVLIQAVCNAAAKTSPNYGDDHNPVIGPAHMAYWLGSVVSAFAPYDANLSLIAASPTSTQNTTTYTTSSSYSLGWTAGDQLPVASFSFGASTSHDITKWNAYQFSRPQGGPFGANPQLVYHLWTQNSPFNLLLPDRGSNDVDGYWSDVSDYHLPDIASISNGKEQLNAQNLAFFQVNNNADVVALNPVIIGYMYEWQGSDKNPLIEYPFVFSPGVLRINAQAADTPSPIKSVHFINLPSNQSDGRWNVASGVQAQGTIEIAFTGTPPQRIILFHTTDGDYFPGSGLRWTSNSDDPNGAAVTLTVSLDPNTGTMKVPIYALAGVGGSPQAFVWVSAFDPDSAAKTQQEISEKILLVQN